MQSGLPLKQNKLTKRSVSLNVLELGHYRFSFSIAAKLIVYTLQFYGRKMFLCGYQGLSGSQNVATKMVQNGCFLPEHLPINFFAALCSLCLLSRNVLPQTAEKNLANQIFSPNEIKFQFNRQQSCYLQHPFAVNDS